MAGKSFPERYVRHVSVFTELYDKIFHVLPTNAAWHYGVNLRGALNNLHAKVVLPPGKMAKALDIYQRRVVFIGTELGTIVVHEFDKINVTDDAIIFEADERLIEHGIFLRSGCVIKPLDLWELTQPTFHAKVAKAKKEFQPLTEDESWNSLSIESTQAQLATISAKVGKQTLVPYKPHY